MSKERARGPTQTAVLVGAIVAGLIGMLEASQALLGAHDQAVRWALSAVLLLAGAVLTWAHVSRRAHAR